MSFPEQLANHIIRDIQERERQKQLEIERFNEDHRRRCNEKLAKIKILKVLLETFEDSLTTPLREHYLNELENLCMEYEMYSLESIENLIQELMDSVDRCQEVRWKKKQEEDRFNLLLLLHLLLWFRKRD